MSSFTTSLYIFAAASNDALSFMGPFICALACAIRSAFSLEAALLTNTIFPTSNFSSSTPAVTRAAHARGAIVKVIFENCFLNDSQKVRLCLFEKALPWLQKAGAVLTLFDPAIGGPFNATVNIISTVEQKYAALGQQSGTGASKLADALQIGEPVIAQGLKLAGMPNSTADVTAYINAVVKIMKATPAPATS